MLLASLTTCSAPAFSIVTDSVGFTSATVSVTAPTPAPPGGWTKIVVNLCPTQGSCFNQDCSPVKAAPAATSCALTSLAAGTSYSLKVAAVGTGITSPRSAAQTLKTLTAK